MKKSNMYKIKVSSGAAKYFKKLKKKDRNLLRKMYNAVDDIQKNPYEAGTLKKGDLSTIYGYDLYHQGSNYEIAYKMEVDDEGNTILIILAGSRENFYEQLKSYMQ